MTPQDAVVGATKAAAGWGKRAAFNRAQICYYLAENLEMRESEFANTLFKMNMEGRDLSSCKREVKKAVERLFFFAANSDKNGGEVKETTLYGVVCKFGVASTKSWLGISLRIGVLGLWKDFGLVRDGPELSANLCQGNLFLPLEAEC
jgi:hypothetical protein